MSPGACRALVASLFTMVVTTTALGVGALPAAAESEELTESALVTYTLQRDGGGIDVDIILRLTNEGSQPADRTWGPIFIEDGAAEADIDFQPRGASRAGEFTELPGPWRSMDIRIPEIDPG